MNMAFLIIGIIIIVILYLQQRVLYTITKNQVKTYNLLKRLFKKNK